MPDLLLELFSEEIPARMQRKAAGDLKKLVTDALVDAGLTYEGAREYWTPRRLTLDLRGLTARSADIKDERKGPRTDAPEKAIEGFLRGAGLSSVDQAEVRSDPKKGDFYVAVINKPGRDAQTIIADVMPGIIATFPWPKSMRWGEKSRDPGSMKWVRPLQSILCLFASDTEEPQVVHFEAGGVASGNTTKGHRFHAPDVIRVKRFDDYVSSLEKAKVVLDAERRKEIIKADAQNLAFAQGLELVEDEALLEEVANLVEWPVPIMGTFDEAFLDIPPEVIRLTIKENQKCFVLRKQATGSPISPPAGEMSPKATEGGSAQGAPQESAVPPSVASSGDETTSPPQGGRLGERGNSVLSNKFLLVANIEATDGGREIALGNAKVVNARLGDAKFFWETDLHQINSESRFEPWLAKLDNVTFHAKLGSQGERVRRIMALAEELAPIVGADPALARRAAEICKADLNSAMVYEFPELQGLMGRRYAERAGEHPAVAAACEDHWKPQGPSDDVPVDPVSVAVALADKLDTLVGFWAIDEKPTGSKDPYALRRAALGVIRLVLENGLRLPVLSKLKEPSERVIDEIRSFRLFTAKADTVGRVVPEMAAFKNKDPLVPDLLTFFHDRLKVYLRDSGARHDLIDAVLSEGSAHSPISPLAGEMSPKATEGGSAQGAPQESAVPPSVASSVDKPTSPPQGGRLGASPNDDLLAITRRVEALGSFLATDDGKNLLAGTKRAANILAAEEKKNTRIADAVDPALFETDAERALFDSLEEAENFAGQAIAQEDYAKAMQFLSKLRAPVDQFFEDVMVNAEDEKIRANRLALMRRIRDATGIVADFSKIAG